MRLQGLIFDLDGTLINSAPSILGAVNGVLKQHGRRGLTLEEVLPMIGDGAMALVARAFEATGGLEGRDTFPLVQAYIGFRRQSPDAVALYPGALERLEFYRKAGVKLGICTNFQERAARALLEQVGILGLFDFVAGGDTYPVHKPHPDHLNGVIEELGVPHEGCVFVGDSPADVHAAKGAKIASIVVTHGYGARMDELGANRLIKGFDELPGALKDMGFTA